MICILIQGKATGGRGGEGSDVEKGGGRRAVKGRWTEGRTKGMEERIRMESEGWKEKGEGRERRRKEGMKERRRRAEG